MGQAALRVLFSLPGADTFVGLVLVLVICALLGSLVGFSLREQRYGAPLALVLTFAPPVTLVALSIPDRLERAMCVDKGGRRSIDVARDALAALRPGEALSLESTYQAHGRARRQTWRVGAAGERMLVSVSPYCSPLVTDWKSASPNEREYGLTWGCGRSGGRWCAHTP